MTVMKTLAALLFLICSSVAFAQLSDFDITAEGKLLGQNVSSKTDKRETAQEWAYDVTMANKTLKDYPNLKIKYIVFVKEVKEGSKTGESSISRNPGETTGAIQPHAKFNFQTNKVSLSKTQLKGDWTYANGARPRSADSLAGIWIRVYDGDKQVGEYINPPTLTSKAHWDAK